MEKFLQEIYDKYEYDFFNYKRDSLAQRIRSFMELKNITGFDELSKNISGNPELFSQLIGKMTISVTSMFRDPETFSFLRKKILPVLATYPHIRIWSAGTGTGEEAYSLAILLMEENLYHRSLIYATDINPLVLKKAQKGVYPLCQMNKYTNNYINAGGKETFSTYFKTTCRYAKIVPELKQNIVFAVHNLTTDSVFNEFQLIMCRNVIIYFNLKF